MHDEVSMTNDNEASDGGKRNGVSGGDGHGTLNSNTYRLPLGARCR